MNFLIVVLVICFFIFLFSLYFLVNDDLIIIKKDMPMNKIFNTAFLTAFVALFCSRVFYVVLFPREVFFSILGFLLFPYFPGLSLLGGVIGGLIFLLVYSKYQKLPVTRTFDFFAISFLSSLPIGFLGFFILSGVSYFPVFVFSFLSYLILFIIFVKLVLPASFKGEIKSGSPGALFLFCFSIVTFLSGIIANFKNPKLISLENIFIVALFVIFSAVIVKQEMMGKRTQG
ncbi:MAG: prolipoprotein diacylglyceryl transferase [Patescibacteria group bacterium]|nr:prolipoprotein diacylglyceryl transferase [Patescibacteria group bacterium]